MPRFIAADNNSLVEGVQVLAIGIGNTAIELEGANCRLIDVECGTGGSTEPQIVVSGALAYLEGVRATQSEDVNILVTGDKARLVGCLTALAHFQTGHGVRFDGSDDSVVNGLYSYQDGFGLVVLNSLRFQGSDVVIWDPARNGVTFDGSDFGVVEGRVHDSGRHGVVVTDSSKNRFEGFVTDAGRETTNTYDGVFFDGDSNRNRTALTVAYSGAGNQMRYGLNYSAGTCDDNIEASLLNGAGATGAYNDAGTGTVVTDDHIV